jgi:hypothetical protein
MGIEPTPETWRYVSPHESEKRQVGVDFMKPCPRFWRISFPHLIGQLKVLKLNFLGGLCAITLHVGNRA